MSSGLNLRQLVTVIIRPTLKMLELWTPQAEELVAGTAIQESDLQYLVQLGGGPAKGLWQMEPATHDDIWSHFLSAKKHSLLRNRILGQSSESSADRLVADLKYACAMCRVHYLRVPAALPALRDWKSQAAYWKRHYNTYLGHGNEEQYMASISRYKMFGGNYG